jgi:nucleoside-diphosphate-sugar epimerase
MKSEQWFSAKRVLVTGASGFIGSRLVSRLVKQGAEVHILIRPQSDLRLLDAVRDSVVVHSYTGTIESVIRVVNDSQPEMMFHLASLFLAQHKPTDINGLVSSNILFGVQLLEAMDNAGLKRLINTGSSWQNYENQAYSPANLYAATKQAFEDILRYYTEARELRVVTLRLFDTYGVGDPRPKLLPLLKRSAETGDTLEMSPGEQKIDLVHVEDVVDSFIAAGVRLLNGEVTSSEIYAVSSLEPLSLRELVATFARVAGKPLNVKWGARPYRPREVMQPWTCGDTLPGWEPKISLADGLREYLTS